jgi:serine/threonine protein kinase
MPLIGGETFAGYRIVRLLGSGGMGEVYLVEHPRLPRRDALKVLPADVSADPDYRARFEREADLASKLWHPHIVSVHDRGEYEGQLWISMDFVEGLDAAHLLASRYPDGIPTDQALRIVTAMASALDYAHKQGLLHRDVKPANIMLAHSEDDEEQRILLADFGIARSVEDISGLTATNMTMGTVAYAAPEQLMGDDLDGRADQYALAATAYHLLTARELFPYSNPAVVISRHLNAPPPALSEIRLELAALDTVFAQALAKKPEKRFARCSEFARALAETGSGQDSGFSSAATRPAAAPPRSSPSDVRKPARSETSNRRGKRGPRPLTAAAIFSAVVLLAAVALIWHPWDQSKRAATPTNTSQPPANSPEASAEPPQPSTPVPPATFPAKAIDDVLLLPDEVNSILATYGMSGDKRIGQMKVDRSTYGMTDNSSLVKPANCVGVVFGAEHGVYADAGFSAIHDETFTKEPYVYNTTGSAPTDLEQTAIVFPSEGDAQSVMTSAQKQWSECASGEVDQRTGPESGYGWNLGDAKHQGALLSVKMASNGPMIPAAACQQVLGVRANVVVTTRACNDVGQSAPGFDTVRNVWPTDPEWANNDAVRLANAMLDKVKV